MSHTWWDFSRDTIVYLPVPYQMLMADSSASILEPALIPHPAIHSICLRIWDWLQAKEPETVTWYNPRIARNNPAMHSAHLGASSSPDISISTPISSITLQTRVTSLESGLEFTYRYLQMMVHPMHLTSGLNSSADLCTTYLSSLHFCHLTFVFVLLICFYWRNRIKRVLRFRLKVWERHG